MSSQAAANQYGPLKPFVCGRLTVLAHTKDEAAQKAGVARAEVIGPRYSDALRGEPSGNRRHPEVTYLGNRALVRRLRANA